MNGALRTAIVIIAGILLYLTSYSQGSCLVKQYSIIKKIIQKSIPDQQAAYSRKLSEFYIIEAILNAKGDSITGIDFFREGKSTNSRFVTRAIKQIKGNWEPGSCG